PTGPGQRRELNKKTVPGLTLMGPQRLERVEIVVGQPREQLGERDVLPKTGSGADRKQWIGKKIGSPHACPRPPGVMRGSCPCAAAPGDRRGSCAHQSQSESPPGTTRPPRAPRPPPPPRRDVPRAEAEARAARRGHRGGDRRSAAD